MARALVKQSGDTRQNFIINGDMKISQRGTLFTSIADGVYSLDRFLYNKNGTMVHSISQDSDVPTVAQSGYAFTNSLLATVTNIDSSIAAGDYCAIQQRIEGYNVAGLVQKPMTLGFWVKASLTGIYSVSIANGGFDRSYIAEYTVNAANTWEYKTITIPASPAAGTWNYTTGVGLAVRWTLASGTTYQAPSGVWSTGDFFGSPNQVNATGTIVATFRLTGVTLVEGSAPSSFRLFGQTIQGELEACQRYYEKSYDIATLPQSLVANGVLQSRWVANTTVQVSFTFATRKRATPAVVIISPNTGALGAIRNVDVGTDVAANVTIAGTNGASFGAALATSNIIAWHYTAVSEL